jgi:hypothetical protein
MGSIPLRATERKIVGIRPPELPIHKHRLHALAYISYINAETISICLDGVYVQIDMTDVPPEVLDWAKAQVIAKKLAGEPTHKIYHTGTIV